MSKDEFANSVDSLVAPARDAFEIAPDDSNDLGKVTKGIYVGTGGDVRIQAVGSDAAVTYSNLPDSSYIAVRVVRVFATGTTATSLIGEA